MVYWEPMQALYGNKIEISRAKYLVFDFSKISLYYEL